MSAFEKPQGGSKGGYSILKLVLVLDQRRVVEIDLEVISYVGNDADTTAKKQAQMSSLKALASRNGDFGYEQYYQEEEDAAVSPRSLSSGREVYDGFLWKKGGGTSIMGRQS